MNFSRWQGISIVFVSGLPDLAGAAEKLGSKAKPGSGDFFFVQLSDTHWGFSNPKINPDPTGTLPKAIDLVNNLPIHPDFIVFTGDLTQTTDDDKERRQRMAEFKKVAATLKNKNVKFLAGEHDASLDNGKAFHEFFGKSYYTFTHKGVHFIALDNVSDPSGSLGGYPVAVAEPAAQKTEKRRPHRRSSPTVPSSISCRNGTGPPETAPRPSISCMPYNNVIVFYGHIHQENHQTTGHIAHHSAPGLMWPLPAPGSVPKKAPIPWDEAAPYKGLGFRSVEAQVRQT